jgi:hypothetical protein
MRSSIVFGSYEIFENGDCYSNLPRRWGNVSGNGKFLSEKYKVKQSTVYAILKNKIRILE